MPDVQRMTQPSITFDNTDDERRRAALALTRAAINADDVANLLDVLRHVGLAPGSEPGSSNLDDWGRTIKTGRKR